MKRTRRMSRLGRFKPKASGLSLTSLMDVFTILVFFLIFNSGTSEVLDVPGDLVLPESVVETKPSETVVINISPNEVLVQGELVMSVEDVMALDGEDAVPIMARLSELRGRVIGIRTQNVAASDSVTILADKAIPFSVIKKVMSSCTAQGYTHISLAVTQKLSATSQSAGG